MYSISGFGCAGASAFGLQVGGVVWPVELWSSDSAEAGSSSPSVVTGTQFSFAGSELVS